MAGTIFNPDMNSVKINENSGFDGYDIFFSIEGQAFHFMAGNRKDPFPLHVKHHFSKKEPCRLCNKTIYPAPYGHQLCTYFQDSREELLHYFMKRFPDSF
ncbi:hypothetical protein [Peribacillus kribbensis]|uniref:hypothetical protein n=1 Tax=Peribacillus kribbensis TaxID=356658 RepID=UPI000425882A|nr:hypothetical protein [Peribacillus kribbensis]